MLFPIMDGASISIVMLLHRIIHLQATIEESKEIRKVKLKHNDKDPEMMIKYKKKV